MSRENGGEKFTARYGILVDLYRCTGCMTCVLACKEENLTPPGVWWSKVLEVEGPELEYISYIPYACMHCDNPPCVSACPEKAIYKREDGIVLVDQEQCRGHGKCRDACPYGVIDINSEQDYFPTKAPYQDISEPFRFHPAGKASKCTLCVHRIEKGREPACVEGCPSKAMIFGDLNDPESPIRAKSRQAEQLLGSEKTDSKIFYMLPQTSLRKLIEERIRKNPRMDRLP